MGYRLIRNKHGCMAIDGVSWSERSADRDPQHDGWPQPSMVGHWSSDHRYYMRRNLFRSPPARGGGDSYQQVRSTRLVVGRGKEAITIYGKFTSSDRP